MAEPSMEELQEMAMGESIQLVHSLVRFAPVAVNYAKVAPAGEDGIDGLYTVVLNFREALETLQAKVEEVAVGREMTLTRLDIKATPLPAASEEVSV